MPFIQVTLGKASTEQKKKIIETFTKEAAEIMGFKESDFLVLVSENPAENWGIGGKTLADIKAGK